MIRAALRILALLGLVAIVGAAWLHLPGDRARESRPTVSTGSEASSASEVLAKIRAVTNGQSSEVSLTATEVGALLSGPLGGYVPPVVGAPSVALDRGTASLTLPVPLESALPLRDVPVVAGVVPDTVHARVRALVASAGGSFSVHVERLAFAGVPVPGFLVPSIARRLGLGAALRDSGAEGSDVPLTWPLPPGLEAVYIDGNRLVLRGNR